MVSRLLRVFPATVTRDARARALKAVIAMEINVGISTGNTVSCHSLSEFWQFTDAAWIGK